MKKVLVVGAVLLTSLFIAVAIGFSLPVAHTARRTIVLRAAPADVWATISDVGAYPAWRPDVDSVEMLAPVGGRQAWRETGSNGEITYAMTRVNPPSTMVTRITDRDLPFGGEWHFAVAREGTGTRVSITEHGEVYSPVYRFVSRFVMGHTSTIDAYLRALGAKLGETVEPATAVTSGS